MTDAGQVWGYAYLSPFNPCSAYRRTTDLSLYVRQDLRGHGVGRALLAELERRAPACGVDTLVSLITDENTASLRFHEVNGFVQEGHLQQVAVKFGRPLGVFFYRKALL